MAEVLCLVRTLDREIRFDIQQVRERIALRVGELAAETVGVQECLPLILRHLPEVSEGSGNQTPAVDGKSAKLLHGAPDLLTLRYGKVLQHLIALNHTATLLGRQVIEPAEVLQHTLLCLGRKIVEAGLALQRMLLLSQRQVAVTIHPLAKMLLVLTRLSCGGACAQSTFGLSLRCRLGRDHRCEGRKKQGCKDWFENAPKCS